MGLDFYIADSMKQLDLNAGTMYISEELMEYLYQNRDEIDLDMQYLFNIDPYGDTLLDIPDIQRMNNILQGIYMGKILDGFEEADEAKQSLNKIMALCAYALKLHKKIAIIGD